MAKVVKKTAVAAAIAVIPGALFATAIIAIGIMTYRRRRA